MQTEYEVRFLEIDVKKFQKNLEEVGAIKKGEFFQRRKTYDFQPKKEGSWIRLRTNGIKTTLCIKEIKGNALDGTKELEIEVSDFDSTDEILNKLGYFCKNYQENKRISYNLGGADVEIDTWPLIPTYAEIEAKNEEALKEACKKLGLDIKDACCLDVLSVYEEVYKIDLQSIPNLIFEDKK